MSTEISPEILERIKLLEEKYQVMGQDLISYLDGLLYADYLTYWDYVKLDVLLNLQQPRTSFPDEQTFIIYHQITELYFKLILNSMDRVAEDDSLNAEKLTLHVERMNRYFDALINSFEVMIEGMDKDQFLKFRMSLLPASGFQSAQYRMIEIRSTHIRNLVHQDKRADLAGSDIKEQYENLYWKSGATELASGKKTLTLRQFEEKYQAPFLELIEESKTKNLLALYEALPDNEKADQKLLDALKGLDNKANVMWPLMHYKSAARYLQKDPEDIAATGGTNWQKYLPPKNQRVIFYPEFWSEGEMESWGR
jgi:tryptophan 2,3-dioxygenase